MKRYLAGAAVVGCLFAIGAGTALAKASYDISSQSGSAGSLSLESTTRLGFGLRADASGPGPYGITGLWAVTAP